MFINSIFAEVAMLPESPLKLEYTAALRNVCIFADDLLFTRDIVNLIPQEVIDYIKYFSSRKVVFAHIKTIVVGTVIKNR